MSTEFIDRKDLAAEVRHFEKKANAVTLKQEAEDKMAAIENKIEGLKNELLIAQRLVEAIEAYVKTERGVV